MNRPLKYAHMTAAGVCIAETSGLLDNIEKGDEDSSGYELHEIFNLQSAQVIA